MGDCLNIDQPDFSPKLLLGTLPQILPRMDWSVSGLERPKNVPARLKGSCGNMYHYNYELISTHSELPPFSHPMWSSG